jgi:hypothetical protein
MCLNHEMSFLVSQCRLITLADIQAAKLRDDSLTDLCKKDIINAFEGVPLANQQHGLLGCVLSEM